MATSPIERHQPTVTRNNPFASNTAVDAESLLRIESRIIGNGIRFLKAESKDDMVEQLKAAAKDNTAEPVKITLDGKERSFERLRNEKGAIVALKEDTAKIYPHASFENGVLIMDKATVYNFASVKGPETVIMDNAIVFAFASVKGPTTIGGDTHVFEDMDFAIPEDLMF